MSTFFRVAVNDDNFIRGAARLLVAGTTIAFPTTVADIINLSTYDANTGWSDLGATKSGVTFTRGNQEETFDVDQILSIIDSRPTEWTETIATQLAEMTLARLQVAWEGSAPGVTSDALFNTMGLGAPLSYTKRRLAILFQKQNGKLRAQVFRKVQHSAQDSAIVYNKTGDQQSVPLTLVALADTSIVDLNQQIQVIFDQV